MNIRVARAGAVVALRRPRSVVRRLPEAERARRRRFGRRTAGRWRGGRSARAAARPRERGSGTHAQANGAHADHGRRARDRGVPRGRAECGAALRGARDVGFLRRHADLARRAGFRRAVRRQLARAAQGMGEPHVQRRPDVLRARARDARVREGRCEQQLDPGVHQLRREQSARRSALQLHGVRQGRERHGRGGQVRAGRRSERRSRPGTAVGRRGRVSRVARGEADDDRARNGASRSSATSGRRESARSSLGPRDARPLEPTSPRRFPSSS